MLKIIISGCNGHMGKVVAGIVGEDKDTAAVAGFDINTEKTGGFPVYADPMEFGGTADVLIDFSHPSALDGILNYCMQKKVPAVLCSTGYSDEQLQQIEDASKVIPVFKSANMSLGINLLLKLLKTASATLLPAGYDAEIEEMHHRRKLDAPSGTALMLADAVNEAAGGRYEYVYGRSDRHEARPAKEIGISSLRGGTVVGIHDAIFAGPDEVIEIKHTAYSRAVFAKGAVQAAKYLAGKGPGLYDMSDVIG